jgi:hypothetical protein
MHFFEKHEIANVVHDCTYSTFKQDQQLKSKYFRIGVFTDEDFKGVQGTSKDRRHK